MEHRTISAKLPTDELTMFKAHCERKGVTPANLLRELILQELKVSIPHQVAGNNLICYNKERDSFAWSIQLDSGNIIEVIQNMSPTFLEALNNLMTLRLNERAAFIDKRKSGSSSVPAYLLTRNNE